MTKKDCGCESPTLSPWDLCPTHLAEFNDWEAKQPKPKWPDDYVRADTPSGWSLRKGWDTTEETPT